MRGRVSKISTAGRSLLPAGCGSPRSLNVVATPMHVHAGLSSLHGSRHFASAADADDNISGSQRITGSSKVKGEDADKGRKWLEPVNLTPKEVVDELGKHIIGQEEAKKAIAIALRNRWRRMKLPPSQQDEIIPKNILMVGPTGCGKTEIARRLAKFCKAPFVKVEATKFTEVGYHGRDVDTIIKDLMDASLLLVKELKTEQYRDEVKPLVEQKLVEALTGPGAAADTVESFRALLREGALDDREVVVDVPVKETRAGGPDMEVSVAGMGGPGATIDIGELMARLSGGAGRGKMSTSARTMKVRDARGALEDAELEKKLGTLDLRREAVTLAEQNGIVFIDEIDKLVSNRSKHSGDASSEGVQRDLLPLIEGTTIEVRRFGNVRTDYILFVASGAFHEHKPSELLAELQGRLPIRVELKGLDARDLERILTETRFNLLEQQTVLLNVEGSSLHFDSEAVVEIAKMAADINRSVENIGARRLHTVIEKIMEDISYNASELGSLCRATDAASPAGGAGSDSAVQLGELAEKLGLKVSFLEGGKVRVTIDKDLVRRKLKPMLERSDFSKFIL